MATVGLLTFMGVWDEFIWALTSIQSPENFTRRLGWWRWTRTSSSTAYNATFAAMVITALPVVLMLIISQRSFLRAVTAGAVKG